MAALGTAFIYFIYSVLSGYTLYWLIQWLKPNSTVRRGGAIIRLLAGVALLAGFAGKMHYNYESGKAEHIGTYSLTSYPNCSDCTIHLYPNDKYEVRQGQQIKEHGPWRYETGDDYWIVYLNEDDQLGVGQYSY
ncbi:hypothetical protein J0X19_10030 [Hymenobacter sp. BT186]|uniref:Uncharacterized protein n=1 Tax=Hymenobacter telluris TaxID=2816474 RepID=A0A939EWF5_9BACT|nr:hypothetical protein [Hymenobacter telluris]MBO0358281.1 hypothetical protein [Hymenobacter telluris]MBW3374307.1 hypothetical protein [Hymenobacter norwichensis]